VRRIPPGWLFVVLVAALILLFRPHGGKDTELSALTGSVTEVPAEAEPGSLFLRFEPVPARSLTSLVSGRSSVGALQVTGSASAVTVRVTSPDGLFAPAAFALPEVAESGSVHVELSFLPAALEGDARDVPLDFVVGYADAANALHEQRYRGMLPVLPRTVVEDAPEGYARFVTGRDPTLRDYAAGLLGGLAPDSLEGERLIARWLYESLSLALEEREGIRFPAEVISAGSGSRDEQAIAYAALLSAAGLDPALVSTPDGLLAGYFDTRGYIVPLRPGEGSYEDALSAGIAAMGGSYEIIALSDAWTRYPPAPYAGNVKAPAMGRQLGRCAVEKASESLWRATLPLRFTGTGVGCAGMVHSDGGRRGGERFACFPVEGTLETEMTALLVGDDVSCEGI